MGPITKQFFTSIWPDICLCLSIIIKLSINAGGMRGRIEFNGSVPHNTYLSAIAGRDKMLYSITFLFFKPWQIKASFFLFSKFSSGFKAAADR